MKLRANLNGRPRIVVVFIVGIVATISAVKWLRTHSKECNSDHQTSWSIFAWLPCAAYNDTDSRMRNSLRSFGTPNLCYCSIAVVGNSELFSYTTSSKAFSSTSVNQLRLFNLDYQTISLIDDRRILSARPRFLTATSENHFSEAVNLLTSIHRQFPYDIVVLYDLGLSNTSNTLLRANYSFVIIKTPDPTLVPKNVLESLLEYRFKPVLIAAELRESDVVMWLDTSSYFAATNCSSQKFEKISKAISDGSSYPIQIFEPTISSSFAVTQPQMYEYFPANTSVLKKTQMFGANIILVYATKRAREEIIRWWLLCALDAHCMAPPGAKLPCKFRDHYADYAECHRFDQSALNVLLGLVNHYNVSRYAWSMHEFLGVARVFVDQRQF